MGDRGFTLTGPLSLNAAAWDAGDPRTFTGATDGDLPFDVSEVYKHHSLEEKTLKYLVNVQDRGRFFRIVLHKINDESDQVNRMVCVVKYFCKMDEFPAKENWYAKIIDTEDKERDVLVVYREKFRPGEQN